MSIWGKVIGGMTGFALGGPLGALIGAVAGHAVDKIRAEGPALISSGLDQTAQRQMAFTVAIVALGAKMAKADGVVTRDEIKAFKEVFRASPHDMKTIGEIFNKAKMDAAGFEPYARQVAELFRHQPAVLEELIGGLFHIARADGGVNAAELNFLRRVADIFGLDAHAFERLRATYVGDDKPNPYEILGVSRTAADAEVKQIYRKLIRENHPDRLVAQGMPQEFIDVANERMAAINAAYDQIEKERGLK